MWSGPPVDAAPTVPPAELSALTQQLTALHQSPEALAAAVQAFADGLPADQKSARLSMLFAVALQRLNGERATLINGIKRYARGQQRMAEKIFRRDTRAGRAAKDGTPPERIADLQAERDLGCTSFHRAPAFTAAGVRAAGAARATRLRAGAPHSGQAAMIRHAMLIAAGIARAHPASARGHRGQACVRGRPAGGRASAGGASLATIKMQGKGIEPPYASHIEMDVRYGRPGRCQVGVLRHVRRRLGASSGRWRRRSKTRW